VPSQAVQVCSDEVAVDGQPARARAVGRADCELVRVRGALLSPLRQQSPERLAHRQRAAAARRPADMHAPAARADRMQRRQRTHRVNIDQRRNVKPQQQRLSMVVVVVVVLRRHDLRRELRDRRHRLPVLRALWREVHAQNSLLLLRTGADSSGSAAMGEREVRLDAASMTSECVVTRGPWTNGSSEHACNSAATTLRSPRPARTRSSRCT
jgi:hypothetical protein